MALWKTGRADERRTQSNDKLYEMLNVAACEMWFDSIELVNQRIDDVKPEATVLWWAVLL